MDFPNIMRPSYPMTVKHENNSIISQFEDGSQQSRQKYTKSRRTFKLKWEMLPNDDYQVLMNFIRNTCKFSALIFNWVNPQKLPDGSYETVEVRATGGFESWELVNVIYWRGELELTEV